MDLERGEDEKALLGGRYSFGKPRDSIESDFSGSTIWDDDPLRQGPRSATFVFVTAVYHIFRRRARRLATDFYHDNEYASRLVSSAQNGLPNWKQVLSFFGSVLIFLLPSFLHPYFRPQAERKPAKVHPTSWLDGIRGFAALFVFFYHFSQRIWASNDIAWGGRQGAEVYTSLLRLPIVRILYAGPAAVSVFFVVSGFALSIRPIAQMWKQDKAGLLSTVSSATLRRPLRLFLPCFAATGLNLVAIRAGYFAATRWVAQNPDILTGVRPPHIGMRGTLGAQVWDWLTKGLAMIDIFSWNLDRYGLFSDDYDKHLWTIPIEFRCSLVLFLTQLALSSLTPLYRISIQAFLAALAQHVGRWDMSLFWGGGILCELYHCYVQQESATKAETKSRILGRLSRFRSITTVASFLFALFLISYPRVSGPSTPGYVTMASMLPRTMNEWQVYHLFQGAGALLLVGTVGVSSKLSKLFSSSLSRYLGQISFALYLVHGCVNHTMGYWLLGWTYELFGAGSGWADVARFGVALLVELILVIWAADLFYRVVDINTVRLARWLEGAMTARKAA